MLILQKNLALKIKCQRCHEKLKRKRADPRNAGSYIYLTDSGRAIAEMIYERHQLLSRGLMSLGVDEQTATEDACRIEHVISQESFEAIKRHLHMTAEK